VDYLELHAKVEELEQIIKEQRLAIADLSMKVNELMKGMENALKKK
jgi:cell division protein FtsL